jgi:ketosteroid isomerase-like protein
MKRSAQLAPLSRDHHVALEHALRLRRADHHDVADAIAAFAAFFAADGKRHFVQEETLLVPQLTAADAELGRRVLHEHAEIRRRLDALSSEPDVAAARELGELITGHVRFEERELFPRLEEALPAAGLDELGRRLAAAGPDVVRRFYAGWNGGELDGLLAAFDPDGEFRPVFGPLHAEPRYRGHAGIAAWFREFQDTWDEFRFEPKAVFEVGGHVLAIVVVVGRAPGRKELCARVAHVFAIRDDRIALLEARDADDTLDELQAGDWTPPA